MRFSLSLLALFLPLSTLAAPVKRDSSTSSDVEVFQFANVLEQLETSFYTAVIQQYTASDFTNAGYASAELVSQQFAAIANDESVHASTLETALTALGAQPIQGCSFNFQSVLTNVETTMAAARVVEFVGVGAYLGAAHLLTDPSLLTAAGSILTVEARHQTILNMFNRGFSIPTSFDMGFTPASVLAMASPFISGCTIPITANPSLSITNTGSIGPGTSLQFQSSAISSGQSSSLYCQMAIPGAVDAEVFPYDQCVVPEGIDGPVAVYITNTAQPLLIDPVVQDSGCITAGPTLVFIDSEQEDVLSSVILGGESIASCIDDISSSESSSYGSVSSGGSYGSVSSGDSSYGSVSSGDSSYGSVSSGDSSYGSVSSGGSYGSVSSGSSYDGSNDTIATISPAQASAIAGNATATEIGSDGQPEPTAPPSANVGQLAQASAFGGASTTADENSAGQAAEETGSAGDVAPASTVSADGASPTGASALGVVSGPNTATGSTSGGDVTVLGWQMPPTRR